MTLHVHALKELLTLVPLSEEQQQQAAELVHKCTSQELASLGLSAPSRPAVPKSLDKLPMRQRLAAVQKVITSIEYNHKAGYLYNVSKDRPFSRIMDTAREVLREALPIKCIEAVFLGTLLTAGWDKDGLQRLPMRFKSMANGQTYKHIVLVVHHVPSHKWGALGISRRQELMYKDLDFDSLADLVLDYKQGYEKWWHKLQKASIGLPFDHDSYSNGAVCWRYCTVSPTKHPWEKCTAVLNRYAEEYKGLSAKFKVLGYPPPRAATKTQDDGDGDTRTAAASKGSAYAPAGNSPAARMGSVSPSKRRPVADKQKGAGAGPGSPMAKRLLDGGMGGHPKPAKGQEPGPTGGSRTALEASSSGASPAHGSGATNGECMTFDKDQNGGEVAGASGPGTAPQANGDALDGPQRGSLGASSDDAPRQSLSAALEALSVGNSNGGQAEAVPAEAGMSRQKTLPLGTSRPGAAVDDSPGEDSDSDDDSDYGVDDG